MRTTALAITLATSVLAACQTTNDELAQAGFERMTGEEIRASLVGNTLQGKDDGGTYAIHYPAYGSMRIAYDAVSGMRDEGTWRVTADQYCRQWKTIAKGTERCVSMHRKGNRIHWVQNGRVTDESNLVPGNPNSL